MDGSLSLTAVGFRGVWISLLYWYFSCCSDEWHATFLTLPAHILGPDAGLNLSYVRLVQHDHTQTALSDTSTDA